MVSPLLPLLLSTAYMGNLDRPANRLLDQDFSFELHPEQLVLPRYGYYIPRERLLNVYFRPWADLLHLGSSSSSGGVSSVKLDKDQFKIFLDVHQFKQEEIEVKVADNYIIVSAKHEEKKDEHGLISRQFVRRYVIPENVDPDSITSSISSDGVLTVEAPVKDLAEDKNVRKVKIEYTGKPALKQYDDTQPEKKDDSTTPSTADSTTADSTDQSSSATP